MSGERPDDEHDVEMEFRDTLARLKAEPLDTRIKALETKESGIQRLGLQACQSQQKIASSFGICCSKRLI